MKVLCVICTHPWMKPAFVDGWKQTGAEVEVFFYSRGIIRRDFSKDGFSKVAEMNTSLVHKAQEMKKFGRLDLIFFSILDDFISIDTLVHLKKLGVPLVNYHADMGYLWYRLLRTGKYFDLVCCAQKLYINEYIERGFKTMFLPFGSNDRINQSYIETSDVSFNGVRYLGSPIVDRPAILGYLYKNGIPVEIYGNHWDWYPRKPTPMPIQTFPKISGFHMPSINEKVWHDTCFYFNARLRAEGWSFLYGLGLKVKHQIFKNEIVAEMFYGGIPTWAILGKYEEDDFANLVRTARINIGFTHLHKRAGPHKFQRQVRLRDVEIPMTGGFLLTEHCDELCSYFEIGKHLETWNNEAELLEKVKWYLNNPVSAQNIAEQGRKHALAHHTWKQRFTDLISLLNISF